MSTGLGPGTPIQFNVTLKEFAYGLTAAVGVGIAGMLGVVYWVTASIKDDVATLKTDSGTVKTDIAAIKGDISPMKTAVTNLQGADKDSVIRLDETARRLEGQLSNVVVQMTALSGKLDTTNSALNYLNTRVEELSHTKK